MKNFCLWLIVFSFSPFLVKAQIADYNQYPTMHVDTYLESSSISFAYSMRRLFSDYTGPIIKLRRSSDNATQVFYATDTDLVDIAAINTWKGASTALYVVAWYDQRGGASVASPVRDAVQTTTDYQPQFYSDPVLPYIAGDGNDDYLEVQNGNIQDITASGREASLFTVAKATNKAQFSFGVSNGMNGTNRWSGHINWSYGSNTDNTYFDPGTTASSNRYFYNVSGTDNWKQYSFIARTTGVLVRQNATVKIDNTTNSSAKCTVNAKFYIFAASDASGGALGYSTTAFNEMIMLNYTVPSDVYESIEQSQLAFWGL